MTIIGKCYDGSAPAVDHAAFFDVAVEQDQVSTVAGPIYGTDYVSICSRFKGVETISPTVIYKHDALIAPIGRYGDFQSGILGSVIAGADTLSVPDHVLDQDVAVQIGQHETFVAAHQTRYLAVSLVVHAADDDFVSVVAVDRQCPNFATRCVYEVVADEHFLPAVAVDVLGVGKVPGVAIVKVPQQLQLVAVGPESAVAVLYQYVRGPCFAGEVADPNAVDVDSVEGVAAERYTGIQAFGGTSEIGVGIPAISRPLLPSRIRIRKSPARTTSFLPSRLTSAI